MSTTEDEIFGPKSSEDQNSAANTPDLNGSNNIEENTDSTASPDDNDYSAADDDTAVKAENQEIDIDTNAFAYDIQDQTADDAMSPEAPGGSAMDLSHLFLRTVAVIVAFWAGSLLVTMPGSTSGRTIAGLFFISIFYFIPRTFYHRYQTVYLNEELRTHFKPKGLIRRFIYATRRLLSGRIMMVLSALMALYIMVICARDGIIILTTAAAVFTLINLLLGTRSGIRLFHASAIPAVYPFYRRWTAILGATISASVVSYFLCPPVAGAQEALRQVGASLSSSGSDPFSLLFDTLRLTSSLQSYVLALATGTVWELPGRLLLTVLPYGILALNTVLGISMLSLSRAEYSFLVGKHEWVKTDRTIWRRYWKSVALPIFLIAFAGAAWHYGSPYYQTYLAKSRLEANSQTNQNVYEKIGSFYYEPGTVRSIARARTVAVSRIRSDLAAASNEVNSAFAENASRLPLFVNWYISRHSRYPFTPGNTQLSSALKTGLNLDAMYIKMQNIRRDLANNVASAYTDLGLEVTDIMKKNAVEASVAEKSGNISTFDENEILSLHSDYGSNMGIFNTFRMNEQLPDFGREILATTSDPNAPWFLPVAAKTNGSADTSDNRADTSFDTFDTGEASDDFSTPNNGQNDDIEPDTIDEISLLSYLNSLLDQAADRVTTSLSKGVGIKPEGDVQDNDGTKSEEQRTGKSAMPTMDEDASDDSVEIGTE